MGIHEKMQRLENVRLQASTGACMIGIAVIIFFCGMGFFGSEGAMKFGLILGIVGGILCKGTHARYKKIYKTLFAEEPLNKNFENVYYAPRHGFDLETVNNFQICAKGNKIKSEDYVKAVYNDINFEMSDVILEDINKSHKSGANILFKGRILKFDFTGKHVSPIRIYSNFFRNRSKSKATAQNKIDMESVNFNQNYDVFAENKHDAFYLLTPAFMEQLQTLQNKYKDISIYICGNTAVVYLDEANDAFDKNNWLEKVSYPDEILKVQSDIDDIKKIIDMTNSRDEYDNLPQDDYIRLIKDAKEKELIRNIFY
jgi:hypothetical protein